MDTELHFSNVHSLENSFSLFLLNTLPISNTAVDTVLCLCSLLNTSIFLRSYLLVSSTALCPAGSVASSSWFSPCWPIHSIRTWAKFLICETVLPPYFSQYFNLISSSPIALFIYIFFSPFGFIPITMHKIYKISKAVFYVFCGFIFFAEACGGFHGFGQGALQSQPVWPYPLPLAVCHSSLTFGD